MPFSFHAKVTGHVLNDSVLECASPASPIEWTVSVTVALSYNNTERNLIPGTNGDSDGPGSSLQFNFYAAELVSAIRPSSGPLRGGTKVTVIGSNFRNTTNLVARFISSGISNTVTEKENVFGATSTTVPARFVSTEELTVEAPSSPLDSEGGLFFVEISSNGFDFVPRRSSPLFSYDASEPFVEELHPVVIRESGGVLLSIRGTSFPETYPSTLACVFGDNILVLAFRHSSELLTCVAPSRPPGAVAVTITFNDQPVASGVELTVEYMHALRILSSSPVLGPAKGGTIVTILGEGFHPQEAYMCAFGLSQTPVSATFVNSTAVTCNAPPILFSQYEGDGVLQVWVVHDEPTTSGSNNSYEITLTGEPTGIVLTTTEDDIDVAPTLLTFQYYDDIEIFRVRPANGPASGGTVVRVSGSGFLNLPQTACQFGVGEPTPARVIDAQTLVCSTTSLFSSMGFPAEAKDTYVKNMSRVEKGAALRVTMNGVDFVPTNTSVSFLYDDDMDVTALAPSRGPETGGVRVLVHGSGFRPDERLACRFGLQVVSAEYVRSDTVACLAPPQARLSKVLVSVTVNGQDFSPEQGSSMVGVGDDGYTEGPMFTYTDRASVLILQPNKGPTRGGTKVHVSGVNFADTSTMLCRFGEVVTTAIFYSTEALTCMSPAVPVGTGRVYLDVTETNTHQFLPGGFQSLEVTSDSDNNPTVWTDSGVEFTFMDDAEVLAAFPSSGPASGGTQVSLTGSGFEDLPELGCRFGNILLKREGDDELADYVAETFGNTAVDVPATFTSPTEVVCSTPPQLLEWSTYETSSAGCTVRVAVTLNGQDYGLKMAQFTYYPTPKVRWIDVYTVQVGHSGYDNDRGECVTCLFDLTCSCQTGQLHVFLCAVSIVESDYCYGGSSVCHVNTPELAECGLPVQMLVTSLANDARKAINYIDIGIIFYAPITLSRGNRINDAQTVSRSF